MNNYTNYFIESGNVKQSVFTRPLTPLILSITAADVAEYLRLDDASDPFLQALTTSANQFVINRLQLELVERGRVVIYPNYPTIGTSNPRALSATRQALKREIELPFANIITVDSVEVYGVAVNAANYQIKKTMPASIEFDVVQIIDTDVDAIKIEYTAGFGATADDVPEDLKFAITMLAAYLYEHRGCGMADAFKESGADEMTRHYNQNLAVF